MPLSQIRLYFRYYFRCHYVISIRCYAAIAISLAYYDAIAIIDIIISIFDYFCFHTPLIASASPLIAPCADAATPFRQMLMPYGTDAPCIRRERWRQMLMPAPPSDTPARRCALSHADDMLRMPPFYAALPLLILLAYA